MKDKTLLKIIISSILFVIGFIISNELISNIIFILSYIIIGYKIIIKSIKHILKGDIFDEFFLMTIATIGAFLIGEMPEGIAVMLFFQIGEWLEDKAIDNSTKSITKLMDLRSDYANLKVEKDIQKISPEKLKINDLIIVKPGERIPVDGIIVEGKSTLDTASLTGESIPVSVKENSEVLSGSINLQGTLTIKVTKEFRNSTVSKILELVTSASEKKTNTEKFITKFAKIYTPIVTISALIIFLVPVLFFKGQIDIWAYRALVFLVISCPCALVISIPLGFFSGIGCASKYGIIIKGSNDLESLTNINSIIFDKTGTLTKGDFKVTKIIPKNITEKELLSLVAQVESNSNHPIALSILEACNKKINKKDVNNIKEIAGKGIEAVVKKDKILIGNEKLMNENNIKCDIPNEIGTIIYVAKNNKFIGNIIISDEIKPNVNAMIKNLKNMNLTDITVLSGDNKKIVEKVCNKLNIDNYYAELLPQDKVKILSDYQKTGRKILSIGDGINDAPLLINSNIGVSMGSIGSDAAIEASDIIIMEDDPSKVITALNIAKKTKNIVWFNIAFALTIKILVLILGALGMTSIWAAVFADVGVTIIAILNSIRILKIKFN